MKIASWNVNSVRARLALVTRWLEAAAPDIICLQELKCEAPDFPAQAFKDLGYESVVLGQKSYNGVAVLARGPIKLIASGLPTLPDDTQARFLDIEAMGVRVMGFYAPNGNPIGTEKFSYKLEWLAALEAYVAQVRSDGTECLLMGDFNIIPTQHDCLNPQAWAGDALFQPESRARFRRLLYTGFTDALRMHAPDAQLFTFWDYQAGAWQRNDGIRIDHILLSPRLADSCIDCTIDSTPRGWDSPSDHVPIFVTLKD